MELNSGEVLHRTGRRGMIAEVLAEGERSAGKFGSRSSNDTLRKKRRGSVGGRDNKVTQYKNTIAQKETDFTTVRYCRRSPPGL